MMDELTTAQCDASHTTERETAWRDAQSPSARAFANPVPAALAQGLASKQGVNQYEPDGAGEENDAGNQDTKVSRCVVTVRFEAVIEGGHLHLQSPTSRPESRPPADCSIESEQKRRVPPPFLTAHIGEQPAEQAAERQPLPAATGCTDQAKASPLSGFDPG